MGTVKCYSCNGTKKLLSLGNLVKECSTCLGIGYIKSDDSISVKPISPFKVVNDDEQLLSIKKKKGRPFSKPKSIDSINV